MSDPYLETAAIQSDIHMHRRVAACASQEGVTDGVDDWVFAHSWQYAAAPGWGTAWGSAIASGIAEPGADPAVITDSQILTEVQAILGAS